MDNKTELRIKAKNIRKGLPISSISETLVDLVRKHPFYINARNVMIFYPTMYEVNLLALLSDDKKFYLPKVFGQDIGVCPYNCGDNLEKSLFNIFEPCSNTVGAEVLDLVIVPALLVDKKGYRLGYGGGFYDRFLAQTGVNYKTICAIPKELCVESLPVEKFDIKVDEIITT